MSSLLITNCRLYDVPGEAPLRSILVRNGTIERIGEAAPTPVADQVLDAGGRTVSPGFIEVHIQGAGGADTLDATPERFRRSRKPAPASA